MKLSESAGGGNCFLPRLKSERKQGYVPALRKNDAYHRDFNIQPSFESTLLVVGNVA
jgi:hypothetical protein